MNTLTRKLWRELYETRTQAIAIIAVIASGVAVFVMSFSTLRFLEETRATYYDRYRFGHVFASVNRAPNYVADQLAGIKGIGALQTRIVTDVILDVPGLNEPATGRLISVDDFSYPRINDVYLRQGRFPSAGKADEALVSEAFFQANRLQLEDTIQAVVNGRRQSLRIVGVALSPEYVFSIRAGDLLPDNHRFGIFWVNREHLEAAFDMEGAFNDVSLRLEHGASIPEVLLHVDRLLERYGSVGAIHRDDQLSASFLDDEIQQLQGMAVIAPTIFLGVAAFLLNVVLARRIGMQREIIATLKAFGFGTVEIALHYLATALIIAVIGSVLGAIAGTWLASGLSKLYLQFYKFPEFDYQPDPRAMVVGALISLGAAVFGAIRSVVAVVKLQPAEAMRPATPPRVRRSLLELLGLSWLLPLSAKMILRQLQRRPFAAMFSTLGISAAVALMLMGNFAPDAIGYLIDFQFRLSQRQDLQVSFERTLSEDAYFALKQLPGVEAVETFRAVGVRMRNAHYERRTSIMGLGERRDLYRLLDADEQLVRLPPSGLVLGDALAAFLHVSVGDEVVVEVIEGQRPTLVLPVTGLTKQYAGLTAYCDREYLHRILRESHVHSGAFVSVDAAQLPKLYRDLKQTPAVASVASKAATISQFESTIKENQMKFQFFNVIFAGIIAVGVVYNTARVSLDERARELSTLRVIGFSRGEVGFLLLGELALLTLMAIPVGWAIGYAFCYSMVLGFQSEQYRIPLYIQPRSFALSAGVTVVAAIVSGLIVRRRLDEINMVDVLKSRE